MRPLPAAACAVMREGGIRACCLDDEAYVSADAAPQVYATVRALLDAIVEANPDYRWHVTSGGLVDLYPRQSLLNEIAMPLHLTDVGLWKALEERLQLRRHNIDLFLEFREGDGPEVSVDLPASPLGVVLDALVEQVPEAVWHISGQAELRFLTVTAIR